MLPRHGFQVVVVLAATETEKRYGLSSFLEDTSLQLGDLAEKRDLLADISKISCTEDSRGCRMPWDL